MVHDAAARGFARGATAYAVARPSYHPALIARLYDRVPGPVVAEIGAGTGIFTAQIATSAQLLVALEPVEQMQRTLRANVPAARVVGGTAEALPLRESSVNTVVAAQSFHWFDAPVALDDIARVLRPKGCLVTAWNVRDEDVPWVREYTRVMDSFSGDAPRYRTMTWRRAIEDDDRFALVDEWTIANPQPTDEAGVVHRALSTSFIAALPTEAQDEVIAAVKAIVAPLGPTFAFPYTSEMQVWQRRW